MDREGFLPALAAAQTLAATAEEAVAVVQATQGNRFLVPLGVWNPNDESMLSFDDAGGLPHYTSKNQHVLLRPIGTADVEAVVYADGSSWNNFTGHPVKLPA
jgi:hypothetical protein